MKGQKSTTNILKGKVSGLKSENEYLSEEVNTLSAQLEQALLQLQSAISERDTAVTENTSLKSQLGVLPVNEQDRQEELKNMGFTLNQLYTLKKHVSGGDTDIELGLMIRYSPLNDLHNYSVKPDEYVILVDAIRSQYIEIKHGEINAEVLGKTGFTLIDKPNSAKKFSDLKASDLSQGSVNAGTLGMSDYRTGVYLSNKPNTKKTDEFMPHNAEIIKGILEKLDKRDQIFNSEEIFVMAQMTQHNAIMRHLIDMDNSKINSDGHKERFDKVHGELSV